MSILNRKESLVLALGDIATFLIALCFMLVLRYGTTLDWQIFYAHAAPFSLLFVAWLAVFFIAGLYEKHTLLLQGRLPQIVINSAIINSLIAVLFFYFIPYFGIAPKVNLFLYLLISSILILYWRMQGYRFLYGKKKQNAISIGSGSELAELALEVNQNPRYDIRFVASVDVDTLNPSDFRKNVLSRLEEEQVSLIAADLKNKNIEPVLPYLYNLVFRNIQFVEIHQLYEEIFDRIPLSLITYDWFLEHVSSLPSAGYDAFKRFMDISLSLVLGLISLVFYPFIIAAIKLDDRGPIFIVQERIGAGGKTIRIVKFRTMNRDDAGDVRAVSKNAPTKVGPFLRKSRLDELPQFWNIIKGDLSLIGPRPELPSLVSVYEREVPYYAIRHIIKPGLSGWAQLYHDKHPHHKADVFETRVKFSYDLYYIKNRSLFLDMKIALRTLKTLLSRSGV